MRPTWVEISRAALRHNFGVLRARAQAAGSDLLCVIKADAYGHGLAICGRELVAAGAGSLGVTSVEEGVRLREALAEDEHPLPIQKLTHDLLPGRPRILVMGGAWKGEAEAVLEHDLTPVVWEDYQIDLLEQGARRAGVEPGHLAVHIEVETGMARQGVTVAKLPTLLARLKPETGTALSFEGLHTHYASAENHASDQNQRQTARFCQAGLAARKADMWPRYLHGGNSSTLAATDGTLQRLHELARGLGAHLLVRPGLGLFGYLLPERQHGDGSEAAAEISAQLRPVLAWKTRVIGLRDLPPGYTVGYGATWVTGSARKIALLPVGYADGYSRRNSRTNVTENDANAAGGEVLVRGHRAPVVGRVSMDLTMIDVTDIPGVEVGDEVALLGQQDSESITAEEMGRVRATIPYEVLCGVGARVKRVAVE
jgi:alanine racemase